MNNNFDEYKFIELMNKEYSLNGRSATFKEGENAIMESDDFTFMLKCAEKIGAIDINGISRAIIKIDIDEEDLNIDYEYFVLKYIYIHTSMCKFMEADHKGHIKKLLEIKRLGNSRKSDLLSECLAIATEHCPELIDEILKRKLEIGEFSWNDFKICYRAIDKKQISSEDMMKLNLNFLDKLGSFELDVRNFDLIEDLIIKGIFDKKEVYNIITNNKKAYPQARMKCFKELTHEGILISKEDYTKLAKMLINDFRKETEYNTEKYQSELKDYIKQYNKKYNKEAVAKQLKGLIAAMIENNNEQEAENNTSKVKDENNAETLNIQNTTEQGLNQ